VSHLLAGSQKLVHGLEGLAYGVSVTDACIDWETTDAILRKAGELLTAPGKRRSVAGSR
jgi:3-deoxy-7-phosphoheptulonate synthase